jgi:hypothetical protein
MGHESLAAASSANQQPFPFSGTSVAMGDEERGQLAAARLGITSMLVAWFVGSLLVVFVDDVQTFALRGANLANGTAVTLLLGGAACMVIAVVLWFDSSPRVMHARRLRQSTPLLAAERRDA